MSYEQSEIKSSHRAIKGVRIAGSGMALPKRTLTNEDLEKLVETNDEWITKRTGIKTRRIVEEGTTVRDLAGAAVKQALSNAGLEPGDLDMVLLATLSPELACPSTAARLVADIGAQPAGAMDLSAACSGFVYGLNLASAMISCGQYKTVAVVGAETLSHITDYTDRRTCILFGDGAGAAVLTADSDNTRGCLVQSMYSNGDLWKELYIPKSEADLPEQHEGFSGNYNKLQMNGREVYKFAVTTTEKAIDETLSKAGIKGEDLAMLIPHQSNKRIIESARQRLGLPEEKVWVNIDRFGNTSAASVPICLHELMEQKKISQGDLVLFFAIGGGMTWATSLWRM